MLWALALLCVGIALEGEELGIHKSLLEAAEKGDATAQSLLAQAKASFQTFFLSEDFLFGANGVKKDLHTGLRWAISAADAGERCGAVSKNRFDTLGKHAICMNVQ